MLGEQKSLRFLVSARVASEPAFFCAMKRCPIVAKIAGSIGLLQCCV